MKIANILKKKKKSLSDVFSQCNKEPYNAILLPSATVTKFHNQYEVQIFFLFTVACPCRFLCYSIAHCLKFL